MRGRDKYKPKPKPPRAVPKFAYDDRIRIRKIWKPGFSIVCLHCNREEKEPPITVSVSRLVENTVTFAGYLCFLCARDAGMLKIEKPGPITNLFDDEGEE